MENSLIDINNYEVELIALKVESERLSQKIQLLQTRIDELSRQHVVNESSVTSVVPQGLERDRLLSVHFERFLEQRSTELQATTFQCKYVAHRKWVKTILGDSFLLSDFNTTNTQSIADTLKERLRPTSMRNKFQVLCLFWDWMQPDVEAKINPWRKAISGTWDTNNRTKEGDDFTDEEQALILETINRNGIYKGWKDVVSFAMLSHCTIQEALTVKWDDIDIRNQFVTLPRRDEYRKTDGTMVSMPSKLKTLLLLMISNPSTNTSGRVFILSDDKTPKEMSISFGIAWKRICEISGVRHRRLGIRK
ncbi:hypothetical protein [Nostoc sp. C117]|uniref:hypothetical protein n=1 Tax=Nostoc sp. C117 TaxID=3349875 RepID=UPI00370D8A45